jgi:hypothetical protein
MRFAGTWSRYSNNAIPHDTSAAIHHGRSARLRRWPYHASVMNTFEPVSRAAQASAGCCRSQEPFMEGRGGKTAIMANGAARAPSTLPGLPAPALTAPARHRGAGAPVAATGHIPCVEAAMERAAMTPLVLRRWLGGLSLRARLMLLVIALAIPFLAYMGALVWTQAEGERAEALDRSEWLAGLLATRVDDFIGDTDEFLRLVGHATADVSPVAMQRYVDSLRPDLRPYLGDVALWSLDGTPLAALDPQTRAAPYPSPAAKRSARRCAPARSASRRR